MSLLPAAKLEIAWCGETTFTPVIDPWKKYLITDVVYMGGWGGESYILNKEQKIRKN